ncbi:MAG: ATP-binding cassette subfamily F protein uup [Planctomycetota bacterium]|jgi:ATP-binding cassette subfamily F protein uup
MLCAMTLISLEGGSKGFNDRSLFTNAQFELGEGERIGLVGRNGCGKSSLLKILAGAEVPDEGVVTVKKGHRVGYLEQEPALDPTRRVREVVRDGLIGRSETLAAIEVVHTKMATADGDALDRLMTRLDQLEHELEARGGHDVEHRIEATLDALDLRDPQALTGSLSGGERRRVALCQLLVGRPDVLLLDEPTNHLDAFVTDWLEDWFLETKCPLVIVTHDRYLLERVVDRIVEIDGGALHNYAGGYSDYLEGRADRLSAEGRLESTRLTLLRRETAWIRRGPPARTTKSKARIQRYDDLVDKAPDISPENLEFLIPPGPRLGTRVVTMKGIAKSYGEREIIRSLDLEMTPGMRLGVIGPNGAGKSTFMKMVTGDLEPDSGSREIGETVRFMGIDQERVDIDPNATVIENVAGNQDVVRVGDRTVRIESFLEKFGFDARMRLSLVKTLSGGERNRVLLAKLLLADGNMLILDEPTNDLDLATLRALEEALTVFPGAAIVVSHDRWFLDRVATHILYVDGKGGTYLHHGDVADLIKRIAAEREADRLAEVRQRRGGGKGGGKAAELAAAPAAQPKKSRLTPWQEKELGKIEGKIAAQEKAIAELDVKLASGDLYKIGTDPSVAKGLQKDRETAQETLDATYARWEELEALRG